MLLRGIVNGTYHMQGKINSIGINLIQEKIAETETLLEKANASLIASVALTENKGLDFTMKDGTHLYTESVQGPVGPVGPQGVTWTPHYDEDGYLSWTNDGGLPCPDPVYIKGDTGEKGDRGYDGRDGDSGEDGYTPVRGVDYYTPDTEVEVVLLVDSSYTTEDTTNESDDFVKTVIDNCDSMYKLGIVKFGR